jgi:uncharacterized protein with PIN domain
MRLDLKDAVASIGIVILAMALVNYAVAQDQTPKVSEVTRLRAANAALTREVTVRRFLDAKANFDKMVADAQAEYAKLEKELASATAAAYEEAGVSQAEFDFDPVTGAFKPKATPPVEKKAP